MEAPTTANRVSIPRASTSMAWARTMSAMVITGKDSPQGAPVAGSLEPGPVVPMQPPRTLAQMMKKRSGSSGRPRPTIRVHHPGLPVTGWVEARYWSPVRACITRTALERSAFSWP